MSRTLGIDHVPILLKKVAEDIPCSFLEGVLRFGNESGQDRQQYRENFKSLRVPQEKIVYYNILYNWM